MTGIIVTQFVMDLRGPFPECMISFCKLLVWGKYIKGADISPK